MNIYKHTGPGYYIGRVVIVQAESLGLDVHIIRV